MQLPRPDAVLTLMQQLTKVCGGSPRLGRDLDAAAALERLIAAVGGPEGQPDRDRAGRRALAELERRSAEQVSMSGLAEQLGVSRDVLAQQVRRLTGSTPTDYLVRYRLGRAKDLLTTTDRPIAEVAQDVGYQDPAYFSRLFARRVGCPPTVFRAQNR
jgi:AraC-like DNA-binding protein